MTIFPQEGRGQAMRRGVKGVAFDMDGLLLNTEDLYQLVGMELMKKRGKEYREDVRRKMIGLPAPKAFGVLIEEERLDDTWEQLQRETDDLFEQILEAKLELMKGVEEVVAMVEAKGLPRCVATSSTRSFARKALNQKKLLARMNFLITAEDVPRGKPHPDIYEEAAKKMGIQAEEMLVLEDSEHGTAAGVAAKAIVVSVPNEHTKHGRFDGAAMIADTLLDVRLKELLDRS
ncbi:MAG: HAD family hydrolase [Planctomycetota bacterium]